MNILFCNIAWMKFYNGISEDDAPYYGGELKRKGKEGTESANFRDYNGKCCGFFEFKGNLDLKKYTEEAKADPSSLLNVLVIWIAENKKNEMKIVGWYKNATIYREIQSIKSYFFPEFSRYYRIEALSKDCHLLRETDRSYSVDLNGLSKFALNQKHSNAWVYDSTKQEDPGLSKLLTYIEGNEHHFVETYLSEEVINDMLPETNTDFTNYQALLIKGIEYYDNWETLTALRYFNTARAVNETVEVLWEIYYCLFELFSFDKAKIIMDRIVELDGSNLDTIRQYIGIYDALGDREKTLAYCEEYLKYEPQSSEEKEVFTGISNVMYSIYHDRKDRKNAEASLRRAMKYTKDSETLSMMNKSLEFLDQASKSWK